MGTTNSILCMRSVHSCIGMLVKEWKKGNSVRPGRILPLWRRITKKLVLRPRKVKEKKVMVTSSKRRLIIGNAAWKGSGTIIIRSPRALSPFILKLVFFLSTIRHKRKWAALVLLVLKGLSPHLYQVHVAPMKLFLRLSNSKHVGRSNWPHRYLSSKFNVKRSTMDSNLF